jgi:hypothetical protein
MTLYIIIPLSMKRNGTIVPTADNAIYGESYLKEKHSRKKQDNPIGRLASSVFRDGFPPEITMQSTALAMAMNRQAMICVNGDISCTFSLVWKSIERMSLIYRLAACHLLCPSIVLPTSSL